MTTTELEASTLAGLRTKLLTPAVIAKFAAALQEELIAKRLESASRNADHRAELESTRSLMAKLIAQLEDEDDAPKSLMHRLKDLEREEERLVRLLDASRSPT